MLSRSTHFTRAKLKKIPLGYIWQWFGYKALIGFWDNILRLVAEKGTNIC